jgi:hypothetical protein
VDWTLGWRQRCVAWSTHDKFNMYRMNTCAHNASTPVSILLTALFTLWIWDLCKLELVNLAVGCV